MPSSDVTLSTPTRTLEHTAAQPRAKDPRWLILVVVSIAQLMVVLDATVVNIALPSAQADLGFGSDQRQWIVTAYALAFGSLLLLGGRIGDMFGRKRVFLVGLAAFAVASAIGGAAPSFGVLVTARALQGVAGAMLAPAALSTLVTTFRDPRDRGRAFGVFGTVAVAGGAVGLILGGVLTQYLSWRWAMYVNVVFAVAAAAGALIWMTHERPTTRPRIDVVGTVLASAGLFALVFGFSRAESDGWSALTTVLSLVAGVALLAVFMVVEQRIDAPLLPMRVVGDRARGTAFAAVGLAGIAMFGVFLFLTYYLQAVKGFSPVSSGFAFLPMIACVMISSNTSNIVTLPRFGPRPVITIGMLLGCAALAYLSRIDVHSSYAAHVLPSLIVMGFAMGMVMAPAMNTATAGVQPADSGVAAALVSTMQQVGGAIGTAVLSTIVATATTNYAASRPPGTANIAHNAATHGFSVAFAVSSALFALGAVMGASLFPSKTRIAELRAAASAPTGTNARVESPDKQAMADTVFIEV
ncbi:MFS transporter [Jatrophihabitans lederbergiae]|uniref:MFS transporter n=1 Tax=Jatrophihabitans lederbergiae TaxID=3075547 RepID=A0ABU2JHM2_9ACTN|nr:MFS transporter [Jatrophihabitans sp. DSM 44399]MDT0264204.1 MFS transporter [Jatrophihabitans sp. DSM 44399]